MMFQNMRKYSHEEFINIIKDMTEEELIAFSSNYGGYPVLFRMALDERVKHLPFIQTGSSIIIECDNKILLQERTDKNIWGLPGGCQEIGEQLEDTAVRECFEETNIQVEKDNLILINTLSGTSRRNSYPNGDIVYNNSSLYYISMESSEIANMKPNSESKQLKFFDISSLPENIMDKDLIDEYVKFKSKLNKRSELMK